MTVELYELQKKNFEQVFNLLNADLRQYCYCIFVYLFKNLRVEVNEYCIITSFFEEHLHHKILLKTHNIASQETLNYLYIHRHDGKE